MNKKIKHGFTLIEILIVIVIIAVLAALMATNLFGARERANDSQKKSRLNQLKIALLLYYSNYHKFPASPLNNGFNFYACGIGGVELCTTSFTADNIEFMAKLPKTLSGQNDFRYYPCGGGDDFRLKINLANASDQDTLASQASCPTSTCSGASLSYGATDYVVCSDN
jgi:prepilin-type N-terminal cleavage/methylation domain-containing protein